MRAVHWIKDGHCGFDFLGYRFVPDRITVAAATIERFVALAIRLYEQEPGEADASARLGSYVRRWVRWSEAGLGRDDRIIRTIPFFQALIPV